MLTELATPAETLHKQAADVIAYFDRPRTANGPTEAIIGRLEHLRGTALGFRNLTNYIARGCLRPADSDPGYTLDADEPVWRVDAGLAPATWPTGRWSKRGARSARCQARAGLGRLWASEACQRRHAERQST